MFRLTADRHNTPQTAQMSGVRSRQRLRTLPDWLKATVLVAGAYAVIIAGGLIGSHVPPEVFAVCGIGALVLGGMALMRGW